MIVYTYIQFMSVIILNTMTSTFDDTQYIFFDLGGVVPITMLLSWTKPKTYLINKRPVGSLFSWTIFCSIYGQVLIMFAFILGTWFNLRAQHFYDKAEKQSDLTTDEDESTVIFYITIPQYVFMGIAFHVSTQFRRPIYSNIPFMILLSIQFAVIGWITLGPQPWMKDALQLSGIDFYFRYIILGSALANGFLTILYEQIVQRTVGKSEMERPIEFGKNRQQYLRNHNDRLSGKSKSD